MTKTYKRIVEHYEKCLEKHGASAKGMDWPNEEDLKVRFGVMLGVVKASQAPVSFLDLGCGVGLLGSYMDEMEINGNISYRGIDVSEKMISNAERLHPGKKFEVRDILTNPLPEKSVDYIVMNGVLTEKRELSQRRMENYAKNLIKSAFSSCRLGLAFNVMSSHVDWFRDDLFHWPLDRAAAFLTENCARHIIVRMDYGLYEYTVYVYRSPNR